MSSRLAKGAANLAIIFLALFNSTPALAVASTPLALSQTSSATPTPTASNSETENGDHQPNLGDDVPGSHEFGEHRNILDDVGGLVALGAAVLIGAATAILVLRSRRNSSMY
ncbi:MAG TPA: hypothetical protein VMV52_00785 [Candidatus Nanopelagicaceae bacterium]|nr:hypothetical protein [Candidatus Nanopelagicaceae bacterium]